MRAGAHPLPGTRVTGGSQGERSGWPRFVQGCHHVAVAGISLQSGPALCQGAGAKLGLALAQRGFPSSVTVAFSASRENAGSRYG